MKKITGLRYCGGCNPKFDRADFVRELQKSHPEWELVYMDRISEADTVYIVSGCERACARTDDLWGKETVHIDNLNMDSFLDKRSK